VEGEDIVLHGHLVEENGENTLLHLSGVLGTKDDHLLVGKVDGDRSSRGHTFGVSVCWERTSIVDGVVGVEVLEVFRVRADQHVAHKESMVGTSANDSDLDAVFLVPSCETVDHVNTISGVEVVDGTFAVDSPDLSRTY